MKLNENTSCLNSFLKISRKQFSVRKRDSLLVWCAASISKRSTDCIAKWQCGRLSHSFCFLLPPPPSPPVVIDAAGFVDTIEKMCAILSGCVWFYLFCKWIYLWLFVCLLRSMATYGLNMCEWMSQMLSFIRCKVELPYQDIVCHLSIAI